jgi:hypothetical protein
MKNRVVILVLGLLALKAHATMVLDKGGWSELSKQAQMGYVIASIDMHFFRVDGNKTENEYKKQIRDCIVGMDTDDFVRVIDMRYEELENYRSPPWWQLQKGLEQVCGVK